MIILLSPTKKQDVTTTPLPFDSTQPIEIDKASFLMDKLKKLSVSQLTKTMKISLALAENTHQKIKNFSEKNTQSQSLTLFQGEAFQKLESATLNKNDLLFAQDHLIILSALYGYLRPFDAVQTYRLDMNNALTISDKENLYHYWKDTVTEGLNNLLLKQKNNIILNLASDEYFKVIDLKKLSGKVIHVDFKVYKNKEYKTIGIYAKRARGLLSRYIIDNKIDSPEKITNFNGDGFQYSKSLSTAENYVLVKAD